MLEKFWNPLEIDVEMKLDEVGVEKLEDWELISLVIRRGTRKTSVFKLAQQIVQYLNERISIPSIDELLEIDGVGVAKACQIQACLELSQRFILRGEGIEINSPEKVVSVLCHLKQSPQEEFWVLCLDNKSKLIAQRQVSRGLVNQTSVHPREAFRFAIEVNSVSVVFAHNHPSGDPTPSRQDIEVTQRLIEVGEILGVQVQDHIIMGRCDWVSMSRKGLIHP